MSILLITTTKGRPKAFEILAKLVAKQTTKDFHWLVVTDGDEGYKFPKTCQVLRRDNSEDKLPSLCENWLAAIDYIEQHEEFDKILVLEDDDWYHREYVLETAALLDRADLAGWNEDAYYYALSRKARRTHNVDFACLASSAFNRSVLPYLKECVQLGVTSIDMLLWRGIKETSKMQQPPITLSSGQVISPPPVSYTNTLKSFGGKKLLAHNFTGMVQAGPEIKWVDGKLIYLSNEPKLDKAGNIEDERPRHVGIKEPFHGGLEGTSGAGHDCRSGGGPDIYGDQLKKWIGETDAKLYLQFTRDPSRNPYPAHVMVSMPVEKD